MFFKTLKLLNWLSAQCRKALYNMAFSSQFKYFGKRTKLDISGAVSIGKNVYIGDDVTIIVEQGRLRLVLVITVLLVKVVISNVLAARLKFGHNVSINSKSFLNGCGGLSIGDNTRIGTQSIMIASNHKFDDPEVLVKDRNYQTGDPNR